MGALPPITAMPAAASIAAQTPKQMDPDAEEQWNSFSSSGSHGYRTVELPPCELEPPDITHLTAPTAECGCRGNLCDYTGVHCKATAYMPTIDGPLATVVLMSGFTNSAASMAGWARFYASHGLLAVTAAPRNTYWNWPASRAAAIVSTVHQLRQENDREGGELCGRVDIDRVGVHGYSFGGGGAQLAAMLEPELIRAVVTLNPHSGGCPACWDQCEDLEHGVPVMLICSGCDCLACTSYHAQPMYERTPASTPKLLMEVDGDHWTVHGPAGGNLCTFIRWCGLCKVCAFGMCPCLCCDCCADDCAADGHDGPPEDFTGREFLGQYALGWLRVFLQGHDELRPFVFNEPEVANKFMMNEGDQAYGTNRSSI